MLRNSALLLFAAALASACQSPMQWRDRGNDDLPPVELLEDEVAMQALSDPFYAPMPELGLATAPHRRFSDMPLPDGVKEDVGRTYVYESASLRIGRMVYNSKAATGELTEFFLDKYRDNGWNLERVVRADGSQIIFTKPGKRLEISIKSLRLRSSREITLHLTPES